MSRARLVAWGGRPGRDIQIGSPADHRRYARQMPLAVHERRVRALAASLNASAAQFRQVGQAVEQAMRPLATLVARQEHVDPDTLRERWSRRARR